MQATERVQPRQRRRRILAILDGQDDHFGRIVALSLHTLILLTAAAFAASTLPDLSETTIKLIVWFEFVAVIIFLLEYVLRVFAAPNPWRYVLSFWGIVDFLAWAPALFFSFSGATTLRLLRLMQLMRMLKIIRYSQALLRLGRAFDQVKAELLLFYFMALFLAYFAAVGIYFFEHEAQPEVYSSIPASLWWAIVSLTTVGYGDTFPITLGGKIFTSFIMLMGMGVFAVPAGVVTSALISPEFEEIEESLEKLETEDEKLRRKQRPVHRRDK